MGKMNLDLHLCQTKKKRVVFLSNDDMTKTKHPCQTKAQEKSYKGDRRLNRREIDTERPIGR
jgi:hypothetical protein